MAHEGKRKMFFNELKIGTATLRIYKPDTAENYPAMLVIPGGGYANIIHTREEGEPIALAYASKGFAAFVLHYSTGKDAPINCPLAEASKAMAYIKRNAEELGVDPKRVYTVGFSAGGHLSGSLATLWHRNEIIERAEIEYGENKPTASVLCYPVVSGVDHPHFGSFQNLLGSVSPSTEELEYYSLEKHVDERSAPAFITHTAEDQLVPVQNSINLANAYANAGVQFELHIYPHGLHGAALGNAITSNGCKTFEQPQYARWVDDSIYFFEHLK